MPDSFIDKSASLHHNKSYLHKIFYKSYFISLKGDSNYASAGNDKNQERSFSGSTCPEIGDNQVLVRDHEKSGICGSDIHVYHGKHPFTKYPVTQGHEVSGQIVKCGANVTEFHEGQKITIEPSGLLMGIAIRAVMANTTSAKSWKVMGFQTTGTASRIFRRGRFQGDTDPGRDVL